MFIVTTLSFDQLSHLIKDKQVSLDNGNLLFGQQTDIVDEYFRERIGYDGYVVGLCGRLNKTTASLFAKMDAGVKSGSRLVLEAEIDKDDVMRFKVEGVNAAAAALSYGLSGEDIYQQLDEAQQYPGDASAPVEILCVPFIKANGKIRVTSMADDTVTFNVEGVTFVKMR